MPKTIPCYDCKGPGCKTCKGGGVLSVYTQAELDEEIKAESKIVDDLTLKAMVEINCESYDNAMGFLRAVRARNKS